MNVLDVFLMHANILPVQLWTKCVYSLIYNEYVVANIQAIELWQSTYFKDLIQKEFKGLTFYLTTDEILHYWHYIGMHKERI